MTSASGSPARRGPRAGPDRGPDGQPVGLVGRSGRRAPGGGHRIAPGQRARRRRVRRPARRDQRASPRSTGCGPTGSPRPGRSAWCNFVDEEGARFGVACAGSRVITGANWRPIAPSASPTPTGSAWPRRCGPPAGTERRRPGRRRRCAGSAPSSNCTSSRAGPDRPRRAGRRRQRHLAARPLADRLPRRGQSCRHHPAWPTARDAMIGFARLVLAARVGGRTARLRWPPSARPGSCPAASTRSRPRRPRWLDARGADEDAVRAAPWPTSPRPPRMSRASVTEESWTPVTRFDPTLISRLRDGAGDGEQPSGARDRRRARRRDPRHGRHPGGDDLRPQPDRGVSHSPAEWAEPDDCQAGVEALAAVLADLAGAA